MHTSYGGDCAPEQKAITLVCDTLFYTHTNNDNTQMLMLFISGWLKMGHTEKQTPCCSSLDLSNENEPAT